MRLNYEAQDYEADTADSETEKYIRIEPVNITLWLLFWVILGMICPVAGLVFWHTWKETRPDIAEAISGGAITTIVTVVLYIVITVIFPLLNRPTYNIWQ